MIILVPAHAIKASHEESSVPGQALLNAHAQANTPLILKPAKEQGASRQAHHERLSNATDENDKARRLWTVAQRDPPEAGSARTSYEKFVGQRPV